MITIIVNPWVKHVGFEFPMTIPYVNLANQLDADSMDTMPTYTIAYLLAHAEDGEVLRSATPPLHVTVVGNYTSPLASQAMVELLNPLMRQLPRAHTTVLQDDLFGEERNIRVQRLEPTVALLELHFQLADLLGSVSDTHFLFPQYLGFEYRPHLTYQGTDPGLPEGAGLTVGELSLEEFTTTGDYRTIHTWRLRGH